MCDCEARSFTSSKFRAVHRTYRRLPYVGARYKRLYSYIFALVCFLVGATLGRHHKMLSLFSSKLIKVHGILRLKNVRQVCQVRLFRKQFEAVGKWFSVFHYLTLTFSRLSFFFFVFRWVSPTHQADALLFTIHIKAVLDFLLMKRVQGNGKNLLVDKVFLFCGDFLLLFHYKVVNNSLFQLNGIEFTWIELWLLLSSRQKYALITQLRFNDRSGRNFVALSAPFFSPIKLIDCLRAEGL